MGRAAVHVGTSGWQYRDWAADLYAGVPAKDWLRRYAERFGAVEVNSTFYGQARPATLERWRLETPEDFRFCLKAHRYLTHVRRLAFEPEALARQKEAAKILGDKLVAMLWQAVGRACTPCPPFPGQCGVHEYMPTRTGLGYP